MFQLTAEEVLNNRSQFVTASNRNVSAPPFAFTEQGVAMLSGVLKSDISIAVNISIMRAFVQVRQYLLASATVSAELNELRAKVDLLQLQQEENLGAGSWSDRKYRRPCSPEHFSSSVSVSRHSVP